MTCICRSFPSHGRSVLPVALARLGGDDPAKQEERRGRSLEGRSSLVNLVGLTRRAALSARRRDRSELGIRSWTSAVLFALKDLLC